MVQGAALHRGNGRRSCCNWVFHRFSCVQRKYLCVGNYRTRPRTKSHIDGTLCTRTSSHVYGSPFLVHWHSSLAWLLVGIVRVLPYNAGAYMENIWRGKIPGEELAGIPGIPEESALSLDTTG